MSQQSYLHNLENFPPLMYCDVRGSYQEYTIYRCLKIFISYVYAIWLILVFPVLLKI